jgi:hypothetical protein
MQAPLTLALGLLAAFATAFSPPTARITARHVRLTSKRVPKLCQVAEQRLSTRFRRSGAGPGDPVFVWSPVSRCLPAWPATS